jgi:hypothetical protein
MVAREQDVAEYLPALRQVEPEESAEVAAREPIIRWTRIRTACLVA